MAQQDNMTMAQVILEAQPRAAEMQERYTPSDAVAILFAMIGMLAQCAEVSQGITDEELWERHFKEQGKQTFLLACHCVRMAQGN